MPGLDVMVFLSIGIALVLLGALTWKHPLWMHKAGYKWISLIEAELMRPRHHRDMELLFTKPTEWTTQHRFTVIWTRVTMGCGALVMGLLITTLTLAAWISRLLH